MQLWSVSPSPALRPFVRAYAQRTVGAFEPRLVEWCPAQTEQILNFELGAMPGIHHRKGLIESTVSIGGTQTAFSGYLELKPGVESFAVFFHPAGWSSLFKTPVSEVTNQMEDATGIMGSSVRGLWNHLGEEKSFAARVRAVEEYLLPRVSMLVARPTLAALMHVIGSEHGTTRMSSLANACGTGLRQFERNFAREAAMSPKAFARVARFQAALDAKLACPQRTWLEIAHDFGYHDQMHMIHDFKGLGRTTPTQLLVEIGDIRPPALNFAQ